LRTLKARPDAAGAGVIIISARAFDPDKERALALGAFGYLVKPIQRQQLLDLLDAYFKGGGPATAPAPAHALPATDEVYLPELDPTRGTLRLYGTRGSTPVPGSAVARYGGNTACLEVRHGKEVVIIDAG